MIVVLAIVIALVILCFLIILLNTKNNRVAVLARNTTREASSVFDNITNGINYYLLEHPGYQKQTRFYYTDGTPSDAYNQAKRAIKDGYKIIVGPYTTEEMKDGAENAVISDGFVKLYTGSCTSLSLGFNKNIWYFIPFNTIISSFIANTINSNKFVKILILYRDDEWGTDYNTYITSTLETELRDKDVISFPYNHELPPGYLTQPIADMKEVLETTTDKVCIVFVGFDECTDYISAVMNDSKFIVPHYSTDAQAYVDTYLQEPYLQFMIATNFSSFSYVGENAYSGLRKTYADKFREKYGTFSNHTFIYYDIMKYIFEGQVILGDFYGTSGNYTVSNNRRQFGTCDGVMIVNDKWVPFSSFISDSEINVQVSRDISRDISENPVPDGNMVSNVPIRIYLGTPMIYTLDRIRTIHIFPDGSVQNDIASIKSYILIKYPIGVTKVYFMIGNVKFVYYISVNSEGKVSFKGNTNSTIYYTMDKYYVMCGETGTLSARLLYLSHDNTTRDLLIDETTAIKYSNRVIFSVGDGYGGVGYIGVGYEGINNVYISDLRDYTCALAMLMVPINSLLSGGYICYGDIINLVNYGTRELYRYQLMIDYPSTTSGLPVDSGAQINLKVTAGGIYGHEGWFFEVSGVRSDVFTMNIYDFETIEKDIYFPSGLKVCPNQDYPLQTLPRYGDLLGMYFVGAQFYEADVGGTDVGSSKASYTTHKWVSADPFWVDANSNLYNRWNSRAAVKFIPTGSRKIGDPIRVGEEFDIQDQTGKSTRFNRCIIYNNYDEGGRVGNLGGNTAIIGDYLNIYYTDPDIPADVVPRAWYYWMYSYTLGDYITITGGKREMLIFRLEDINKHKW